jgi:nucleoside-diphosphate-sugar epimerase
LENKLGSDLDEILERSADDLAALRGAHLFVSGGTGFVGSWLLETLAWANVRLALSARATVLTRDPDAFAVRMPHLNESNGVIALRGDVRTFAATGAYDAVIHAATPGGADLNRDEPLLVLDTIVGGTRRVLETAAASGAIPVLFTSSGAVYGAQPAELAHVPESYVGAPDPLDAKRAYHESKRAAELECALYARSRGIEPKIARMFAFVGPYLPLDRHFAIGNFIGDALRGNPIEVRGDGTTVRSYLYAAEMAMWLFAILVRGEPLRAYNVGSERAINIAALAASVALHAEPPVDVRIANVPKPGDAIDRYVPDTSRARVELGLEERVDLSESIARTLRFHRRSKTVS